MMKIILLIGLVAVIALFGWSVAVSDVEQAKYTVVEKHDAIEVRDYAPHIVAEVMVSGEREPAIQEGFRMIADFIFGNNLSAKKVAMTAPVIQQPSEKIAQKIAQKIAMTAPVLQQGQDNKWVVQFVMPSEYTLASLPKPNNAAVVLKEVAAKRYVALRFSGVAEDSNLKTHSDELSSFIATQKLKVLSPMTYAFFNPPWTLPFMRRNEVMVEVAK
ncbi:MAG: heme-binding protein [Alphaproteobacteria bacterium]|nr:heme-binding protein [Alphaproteobacteria bacterium]